MVSGGDSSTMTYVQLPHRTRRCMSSSVATKATKDTSLQSSYFPHGTEDKPGSSSVVPQPSEGVATGRRSASISTTLTEGPTVAAISTTSPVLAQPNIPEESSAQDKQVKDENRVIYHTIDFQQTGALSEFAMQREQEREREKRDRASTSKKGHAR